MPIYKPVPDPLLQAPTARRFHWMQCAGTAQNTGGMNTSDVSLLNPPTDGDDADGRWNLYTSSVALSQVGISSASGTVLDLRHALILEGVIKTGSSVSSFNNCGLMASNFFADPNDNASFGLTFGTSFGNIAAANADRWHIICGHGGSTNASVHDYLNTGVLVEPNKCYRLRVRIDNPNHVVYASINDSSEYSLASEKGRWDSKQGWTIFADVTGGATRTLRIGSYTATWQAKP